MTRVTVTLSNRIYELLKLEAKRNGGSITEEVRRAADHYVGKHTSFARGPWKYLLPGESNIHWILKSEAGREEEAWVLGTRYDREPKECWQCGDLFVAEAGSLRTGDSQEQITKFIDRLCADRLKENLIRDSNERQEVE